MGAGYSGAYVQVQNSYSGALAQCNNDFVSVCRCGR